ncbi:MAG: biopolymer transporter ExbD [Pseudomonadota bacterium]|nr:biopolymer transporter ExbD [Pseudomonadota bacterium]
MSIKVPTSAQGGMDEINVTPLIDVVLVLLIIFMVMTPVTVRKMSSNLPPPDTEEPPPPPPDTPPDQLMVAVYEDGKIALNLKEGTDEDLMKEVEQRLRSKAKKTVFIDAAPAANYGRVVQVMDLVRTAGAENVGLAELKEEGPARLEPGQALPEPAAAPAGAPGAVPPPAPAG